MMNKKSLLGFLVGFVLIYGVRCERFWERKLRIVNNKEEDETSVLFIFDSKTLILEGKLDNDCKNITFGLDRSSQILSYWMEGGCGTNYTSVWIDVVVEESSTKDVLFMYGNFEPILGFSGSLILWNGKFILGSSGDCNVDSKMELTYENTLNDSPGSHGRFLRHNGDYSTSDLDHIHLSKSFSTGDTSPGKNLRYQLDHDYPLVSNKDHIHKHDFAAGVETSSPLNEIENPYITITYCSSRYLSVEKDFIFFSKDATSGWTVLDGYFGRMPRGSDSRGVTGGSNLHQHLLNLESGVPSNYQQDNCHHDPQIGSIAMWYNHTHTVNVTLSKEGDWPPFFDVVPMKSEAEETIVSENLLLLVTTFPPRGWKEYVDNKDKFIRFGSSFGVTGGNVHSHSYIGGSTGSGNGYGICDDYNTPLSDGSNEKNHTHTFTLLTNNNISLPTFSSNVRIVERNSQENVNVTFIGGELQTNGICNTIPSWNVSSVCSGRGNCTGINNCKCHNIYHFGGRYCEFAVCYGVLENETDSVCNNHGECIDVDNCKCSTPNWYGKWCNVTTCFSVFSNITDEVCSNRGACIDHDVCECKTGFYGERCMFNFTKCFDYLSNDTSNVCNGNVASYGCVEYNVCKCKDGYIGKEAGKDCGVTSCFGYLSNYTAKVCSGEKRNRFCWPKDNCQCEENYFGMTCNVTLCLIGQNNTLGMNNTLVFSNNSFVCGGEERGDCSYYSNCTCVNGFMKRQDNASCDSFQCYGYFPEESGKVCSGHGKCKGIDKCDCNEGYLESRCDEWDCRKIHLRDPLVCSGNGKCVDLNVCECSSQYEGDICENSVSNNSLNIILIAIVAGVVFGVCGLALLIVFLVLCVFLLILVLPVSLCCCCCGIGGSSIFIKNVGGKGIWSENETDMIDKIAMENTASLKIRKELFEINYSEIKVTGILGEGGGNSIVYIAKWQGQDCAFKCFQIRGHLDSQEKFNEFEREAEIIMSIHHPYILSCFGCTLKIPRVGIVMEYCSNGDLRKYFSDLGSKEPIGMRIRVLYQIASAMKFLHSRSIIHRDLKSVNVLLSSSLDAKVMDFGLSRTFDGPSQTKTTKIGTSVYMAPELSVGRGHYDTKCDVFSFAIMIWELVFLDFSPYQEEYGVELKVANDPSFRPSFENREYPEWVEKMCGKCWDAKPEVRLDFETIVEILKEKTEEEIREVEEIENEVEN